MKCLVGMAWLNTVAIYTDYTEQYMLIDKNKSRMDHRCDDFLVYLTLSLIC